MRSLALLCVFLAVSVASRRLPLLSSEMINFINKVNTTWTVSRSKQPRVALGSPLCSFCSFYSGGAELPPRRQQLCEGTVWDVPEGPQTSASVSFIFKERDFPKIALFRARYIHDTHTHKVVSCTLIAGLLLICQTIFTACTKTSSNVGV